MTSSSKAEITAVIPNFIQLKLMAGCTPYPPPPTVTFASVSSTPTAYLSKPPRPQISSTQKDSPLPPMCSLLITHPACHLSISKDQIHVTQGSAGVQRSHRSCPAQDSFILPLLGLPMAPEGLLPSRLPSPLSSLHPPLLSPRLCSVFSPTSSVYRDAQYFPSLISFPAPAVFLSTGLSLLPTPKVVKASLISIFCHHPILPSQVLPMATPPKMSRRTMLSGLLSYFEITSLVAVCDVGTDLIVDTLFSVERALLGRSVLLSPLLLPLLYLFCRIPLVTFITHEWEG